MKNQWTNRNLYLLQAVIEEILKCYQFESKEAESNKYLWLLDMHRRKFDIYAESHNFDADMLEIELTRYLNMYTDVAIRQQSSK